MKKLDCGRAIRILRAARSLSQVAVAGGTNLTESYVSLLENGRRHPSLETVEAFARFFNVPPYFFCMLASDPSDLALADDQFRALISMLFGGKPGGGS